MLRRRSPVPLHEDAANRFLPWIVGLMVYLVALAVVGSLALDGAVARWRQSYTHTLTVQVPAATQRGTDTDMAKALEVLRGTPAVSAARVLSRAELVTLLEPWLGEGNVVADLPLPRLIDVTLRPGTVPDVDALELRLREVAPGAQIDDHGLWLEELTTAVRSLQGVALAAMLAIGAAAVGTVVFTTRTSLTVHRDSIEILHIMGAPDAFVARVFARRALWLGLRGGLLGLGLAVVTLAVVVHLGADLKAPLLPRLQLSPPQFASLAALPVASAFVAMATARATVLRTLARMP